ncbi:MAG: MobC family plasmid mobilization relaxosome protein [Bacteroidales bacterium]|nr:MobC family plasmid mobilization relaxosome protein [Bacteroidales bacterium]
MEKEIKHISKISKADIITDQYGFRIKSVTEEYRVPPTFVDDLWMLTKVKGTIEYYQGLNWRSNYPILWNKELLDKVFRLFKKYAKRQGGRPIKEQKKTRRYTILFSENEYQKLKKLQDKTNKKDLSKLISSILFEKEIKVQYVDKQTENITYELHKIGVNINQIAHYFNIKKELNPELSRQQIEALEKIKTILEDIKTIKNNTKEETKTLEDGDK